MDDFFEVFFFVFIIPALVFVFIFSLVTLADDADKQDEKKKQDTRYELCLKNHKDWVDGNCVTPVK